MYRETPLPMSSNKMFMNWKVPRHLLGEKDDTSPRSASAIVRAFDEVKPVSSRGIPTPGEVLRHDKTTLPAISPCRSSQPSAHSVRSAATSPPACVQSAREPLMSLRSAGSRASASSHREERMPAATPLPTAAASSQPLPRASAVLRKGPSKAFATQQVLQSYNKSDLEKKAEVFLPTATDEERRLVEKVLKLAGSKNSSAADNLAIQRWLATASLRDRKVALEFFQSAAGSKLVGPDAERKDRINNMIRALEKGKKVEVSLRGNRQKGKDTKLQYIRLLTPNTRENRWMHTTWHHLPVYRDYDPVNNPSSIYTMPHKPTPREFKIHPDWGP